MKQTILFAALGLAAFGAAAQEVGHVISSTPVVQQVQVPRQLCSQGAPMVQAPTSGGGGLLGALIGGGIGSAIGAGAGQAAAIVGGTVIGAIVGNNAEANQNRYAQSMPTCTTEMSYENRTVAYNVTYEYGGRQQTVQMPYDPGSTVPLQVSPVGASAPGVAQSGIITAPPVQGAATVVTTPPAQVVYQQQPQVVYQQPYAVYPAYPAPAYYPYYPPIGVSLGFVFRGGGHGYGHGHGRWR